MFKIDDCLGFIANKLVQVFQKAIDRRLAPYGLTSAQFCVLAKLYEEEGLTQTELASRLYIENPTLVRTLDRLERAGVIERRRDPDDRRAYRIYLLEKGRQLRDTVERIGNEVHEVATVGMSEKDADDLRRFLRKIWENLSD
ncbi:MarR family transcriptional regulator [Dissulfurirhabdus thermomarina]|uniref:MarR family transcriptional regulator n=1 Tax=Dissulfurirhabdus thermomarina TaxID=1765737 RepID=A0A6N9TVH5_DISTH|nr:MarR family transcriptional regulator [Dissulfurirhabdus thermomarina]NDY43427.1 MarR family transcriptional regulator [Dissulfurirhabdus thermomarina]NMX23576.1 MarR family transcriptional regulator [Dissulfurirhabdus thermomarina]